MVGEDRQMAGTVRVPICYVGSLNPAAGVQRKRVSETPSGRRSRDSKISYFARAEQMLPAVEAVSRLVDDVRGVGIPTAEGVLVPAPGAAARAKRKASRKVADTGKGPKAPATANVRNAPSSRKRGHA